MMNGEALIRMEPTALDLLVTVHNAQSRLPNLLAAISGLVPQPACLIIVDDASTDSSGEVICAWLCGYSGNYVVASNIENQGVAFSRNLGMMLSRAHQVVVCDDDDLPMPSLLTMHAAAVPDPRRAILVFCEQDVMRGSRLVRPVQVGPSEVAPTLDQFSHFVLLGEMRGTRNTRYALPASAMSITRAAFERLGGFDASFRRGEDVDFVIRALIANVEIRLIQEIGMIRRMMDKKSNSPRADAAGELQLLMKHGNSLLSRRLKLVAGFKIRARLLFFEGKGIRSSLLVAGALALSPLRQGEVVLRSLKYRAKLHRLGP